MINPELQNAILISGQKGYDDGYYKVDKHFNLIAETWKDSKVLSIFSGCIPSPELDIYECNHIFDLLVLNHVYSVDNLYYNIGYDDLVFPLTVKYNVNLRNNLTIKVGDLIIKELNKSQKTYISSCN